jgi:hypothetical protein
MIESRQLAGTVGPALVAVGASEALRYRIFADNTAPLIYLNGTVLLTAGLSIPRSHNRWVRDWPAVLTGAGWVLALVGLFRMFFPTVQQDRQDPRLTVVTASLTAIVGLFLTGKSYSRQMTLAASTVHEHEHQAPSRPAGRKMRRTSPTSLGRAQQHPWSNDPPCEIPRDRSGSPPSNEWSKTPEPVTVGRVDAVWALRSAPR